MASRSRTFGETGNHESQKDAKCEMRNAKSYTGRNKMKKRERETDRPDEKVIGCPPQSARLAKTLVCEALDWLTGNRKESLTV